MNTFTKEQNELYNENCQKFIDKYGVLKNKIILLLKDYLI